MTKLLQGVLFGVLLFQWIYAAPSEIKQEDIVEVKNTKQTEDFEPHTLLDETEPGQGQRQKRWYNYLGLGLPPVLYKRDDDQNTGVYGTESPIVHIHRKLQEISGFVRSPNPPLPPPPLPQFPSLIPVIYIPQVGCGCTPNNTPNRPVNKPQPPQNKNQTVDDPDVIIRWPDMEDDRQNWGLVNNDTVEYDDNDGARPISFDPIKPLRPLNRPPPAVEHGSSQGDLNSLTTTTTTASYPQVPFDGNLQPPSTCDRAVLSCCLQPQDMNTCFTAQGCPDTSAYGNPCESGVVLRVIERFQMYYNQRNG